VSDNKNQISFTAVDIEKYHKGQLSAKERHDLEKAALDDPFLADALEGYATAGVNVSADIFELKQRLAERNKEAKIIPIGATRDRNSFPWLKIAAIIIVMVGAGLLTYQFVFNNNPKDIAQVDSKKLKEIKTIDSNNIASAPLNTDDKTPASAPLQEKQNNSFKEESKGTGAGTTYQSVGSGSVKKETETMNYSSSTNNPLSIASSSEKNQQGFTDSAKAEIKDLAKENKKELADQKETVITGYGAKTKSVTSKTDSGNNDLVTLNKPAGIQNISRSNGSVSGNRQAENQYGNNIFRGRVTDINNNPVPFANITNTQDNKSIATDATGYFDLIAPDSVVNVEVRSIGFENNTAQLRNDVSNNQVILKDDQRSLSEVVVTGLKSNAKRSSKSGKISEEPVPADGWDKYDIYLANNLNLSDELGAKHGTGSVEISLEVDKKGNPTNIRVEKSLCKKCDMEAIRLIKEGPKWNRRNRNGRVIVTIPF